MAYQSSEKCKLFPDDCGRCVIFVHFRQFAGTHHMENASRFQAEKKFLLERIGDILNISSIAYRNVHANTTGKSNDSVDVRNVVRSWFDNQLLFHHNTDIIFYRAWSTEAIENGGRDNRQQYSNHHE